MCWVFTLSFQNFLEGFQVFAHPDSFHFQRLPQVVQYSWVKNVSGLNWKLGLPESIQTSLSFKAYRFSPGKIKVNPVELIRQPNPQTAVTLKSQDFRTFAPFFWGHQRWVTRYTCASANHAPSNKSSELRPWRSPGLELCYELLLMVQKSGVHHRIEP